MSWRGGATFGILAVVFTGSMFMLSLDVGPVGPLALLAPIPLLIYALSAPRAITVAFAAAGARAIGLAGVVYVYDELPLPALLAFVLGFALIYAGVVSATRWLARAAPAALAVFSYPLLLVTAELLLGLVSPHGSFGAMGYSLVDFLPVLQVASVGGVAALTFCVALAPMAIAVALVRPHKWRAALLAGALPFLLALTFGGLRMSQAYESHARVALVGLDKYEASAYRGNQEALETARQFAEQVRKLLPQNPQYIVLPEKQLGGAGDSRASAELLVAAVGAAPVTLVAGFDETLDPHTRLNSAQVFVPGQTLQRYVKRRLIPGLELGYDTGAGPLVLDTRGVAICKDLDFPAMIRGYGERGVQLLLVPAWDFVLDGRMHSRMALVRGVENGFAIARAAAAGRLTASDRYGRIIAEASTSPTAPVTVVTELGLKGGGTWYVRLGDAFAWGCVACLAALLVWRTNKSRVEHR
ncbi:MAG: nitrilase-related carbon-nitrogen hydrolase [Pseudomonadota bacterium]